MSGEHANEAMAKQHKRKAVAESTVSGNVVNFTCNNGEVVSVDVSTLPAAVQFHHAIEGVRAYGRTLFGRVDDAAQAAALLRDRFGKMQSGDVPAHGTRRKKGEVDVLVQALSNVLGRSTDEIEDEYLPKYYSSDKSGCTMTETRDGKMRVNGKKAAKDLLAQQPKIKEEIDRINKQRAAARGKRSEPVPQIDFESIAA